jgi:hypothetical protein
MSPRMLFGSVVTMLLLALPATAGGKGELQKYFNDAAGRVKATENPSEKRQILAQSFQTMTKALDMVESTTAISKDDGIGIDRFKAAIKEKQDELAGLNGFARVPDEKLNAFSDYVVQDMEQADQVVTISLVSLLLIILLIVLILR